MTLCVMLGTRSVPDCIPTRSVGTIQSNARGNDPHPIYSPPVALKPTPSTVNTDSGNNKVSSNALAGRSRWG
ncbi:hypothetical protein SAMN03159398_04345 [Pseudomonas sp. NFPP02]|nr:hypothetical protein SAMN03159398_04345 [Pseudomonas sp. NFPP02]